MIRLQNRVRRRKRIPCETNALQLAAKIAHHLQL